MNETVFNAGDQFIDENWAPEESGQIIAVDVQGSYSVLYEVKWSGGDITYERAEYLRTLKKI